MNFSIQDFDKQLFHQETGFHATEHPHLYFEWLQVKMLEQLTADIRSLKEVLSKETTS